MAHGESGETVLAETRDVVQLAHGHGRVDLSEADRSRMLSTLLGTVENESAEDDSATS